ncbi:hypothetical protein J6590_023902 [Homalodisca vitripennis]|nr:hypothetical protein J6590_023902 [Homalodisca vitripennis]
MGPFCSDDFAMVNDTEMAGLRSPVKREIVAATLEALPRYRDGNGGKKKRTFRILAEYPILSTPTRRYSSALASLPSPPPPLVWDRPASRRDTEQDNTIYRQTRRRYRFCHDAAPRDRLIPVNVNGSDTYTPPPPRRDASTLGNRRRAATSTRPSSVISTVWICTVMTD